jgi:hypothetical protein
VLSAPALYELCTRRLRESDVVSSLGTTVTSMSADPLLDIEDVRVFALVLHLWRERNPLAVTYGPETLRAAREAGVPIPE